MLPFSGLEGRNVEFHFKAHVVMLPDKADGMGSLPSLHPSCLPAMVEACSEGHVSTCSSSQRKMTEQDDGGHASFLKGLEISSSRLFLSVL